MRIFAISDLHLSIARSKPMDVFGMNWENHFEKISDNWRSLISDDDLVLIPGDISWAMALDEAMLDLAAIGELPGKKIIMRGNHDYWWNSVAKVRRKIPAGMFALQNDSINISGVTICGSRGWNCPNSAMFTERDRKIYNREVMRMDLSFKALKKEEGLLIAMTHFPPFNEKFEQSGFTEIYENNSVDIAIYGHLHGKSCKQAFEGEKNNIEYKLVSCDHLGFSPILIAEA